ncbi:MAG TPA: DUF362 domain-containing protein [Verrucomicrobia bacterium]|nr:DUF362 domain-containing protein [Verrucomicrobiota bacterium]
MTVASGLLSPSWLSAQDWGNPKIQLSPSTLSNAKVSIVPCKTYGKEVSQSMARCFDLLGGIGSLVKEKTVTVKINLTGSDFSNLFDRPVGESYMTHPSTVMALTTELFKAGAKRVRFVESTNRRENLEATMVDANFDVNALSALGKVEYENTRNLGLGKAYSNFKMPSGGHLFFYFDLNHSYEDTDVFISLAKLKDHVTAGVTLAMKNIFGITPNSLYGDEAVDENAIKGRGPFHDPKRFSSSLIPGELLEASSTHSGYRVPRIVADLNEIRPIHISIIDGITSMKGGEGPWTGHVEFTQPGVLIAGLNSVSTDAVGTAVMGYDPRALKGKPPFENSDNHLMLAEHHGVGTADLEKIDLRGLTIKEALYPYRKV